MSLIARDIQLPLPLHVSRGKQCSKELCFLAIKAVTVRIIIIKRTTVGKNSCPCSSAALPLPWAVFGRYLYIFLLVAVKVKEVPLAVLTSGSDCRVSDWAREMNGHQETCLASVSICSALGALSLLLISSFLQEMWPKSCE